ncbi:pantetheine-phosphate adenylyltransferase [Flavobacteriaceae bacterium]|jgi:pantetheine-phosphate adenylyltransferase|nr:pantetheine-phosphate adenylyltransferase [Flavobacteriaceae bacterium]MDA7711964.1 pantetheine-phosphate adenylyltransferase [Flavobacteriaceae bacterium]MDA8900381.1 pantetheine-phosphate adenylyltransferase [Flavobacteriaceae bacterium]
MKRMVFPGSFDPITIGHTDIIARTLPLCDELIIAVGENSDKKYMFPLQERIQFIKNTFEGEPKIKVASYSGLTIDYCKTVEATAIIRGLRNPADFEFEKSVAHINRRLSGIETLFLLTSANTSYVSSSIVREIIKYKGDFSQLVPRGVKI